jgi:hypothetical protein
MKENPDLSRLSVAPRQASLMKARTNSCRLRFMDGIEGRSEHELVRASLNESRYITGAGVPSDHLPTGTTNTSIGCTPLNCGFSMTGDFGRSAPQSFPSSGGV